MRASSFLLYSTFLALCASLLDAAAAMAPTMSSKKVWHSPVDLSLSIPRIPGFSLSIYP